MGQKKGKKSYMPMKVHLPLTDETFKVNFVEPSTKIKTLRGYLELASGIPIDIQNIHYLDESDLIDTSDVKNNDIVAGAVLTMDIWHTWKDLIEAAVIGDPDWLFRLGVTKGTTFQTPNSEYMTPKKKQQWIQSRADMALMIAAHRGHAKVCQKLIEWGANVNAKTPMGRTPLHFSATQDHGTVINLLLTNGADINMCDNEGNNALALANMFGHKGCERHLFMFRWQERAKASKPQYLNPPSMAFQLCDSLYPKWKTGVEAQVYLQKLVPPSEFVGTRLNAPKRTWHRKSSAPPHLAPMESEEHYKANAEARKKNSTFDEWVEKKRQEQTTQKELQLQKEIAMIEEEEEKQRLKREKNQTKMAKSRSLVRESSANRSKPNRTGGRHDPGGEGGGDISRALTFASQHSGAGGPGSLEQQQLGGSYGRHRQLPSLQDRIDILMRKHGVGEDDPDTGSAYDRWLVQKNRTGKVGDVGLISQQLPYQLMIREFCDRNCCHTNHYHHFD